MIPRGLAVHAALLLTLNQCAAEPTELDVASRSREIISGTEVVPGDYPWLVFTGGCTGALISPQYVLTAAHCYGYAERNAEGTLEGIAFSSRPVVIGHPDLDSLEGRAYAVSDVLLHPEYIKLTRDEVWGREPYDIALLRLEEPAYIDDYLRLPTRQPEEGELVGVAGWGTTEAGRRAHAREAVLQVRPRSGCFGGDEKRFCSRGGPDEPSANIGAGDSGGPVFVPEGDGFMSLGINSTSNGASENTFASHAATFAFVDWVLEATDGAFSCPDDDPVNGCVALVDECFLGLDDCGANASCEDLEVGFSCPCDPGYAGDGGICADVDECVDGSHDCSPDAVCTNTPGSFTCACAPGFLGDGVTCERAPSGCSAQGTPGGLPFAGCLLLLGLLARRRQPQIEGRGAAGTHTP